MSLNALSPSVKRHSRTFTQDVVRDAVASAVLAVGLCRCVCHKPFELVFNLDLTHTVFKK